MTNNRRGAAVAMVLLFAMGGLASAQDEKVGVTAAVNPQATGTPPQRASRTLNVGLDMIRNERIVTGPEGKTQLLFVDGSALTIGPNAELMLDEFVYDPNTGTGKLAMTATKGVFRVVGGKISKTEAITLKTPTATLGIRGGIATADAGASGFFGFLFGQKMTVDGTGPDGQPVQQVVTRPGTGVPLQNGQVGAPMPIPVELMQAQLRALEGNAGQSGGAREQPTDGRVQAAGLGGLGSDLPPDVVGAEPAAGGGGPTGPGLPGIPNTQNFSQAGFQQPTDSLSGDAPIVPVGSFAGRYKSTPGSGSAAGTAGDGSAFFDRGFVAGAFIGNLFVASPGGDTFSAPVNSAGGFLSFTDAEGNSPFGPISGTSFVSGPPGANVDFLFFESIETGFLDERSFLFAGTATPPGAIPGSGFAAYNLRRDFVGNSNIPFIPAAMGGNLSGTVSPAFVGFAPQGGVRPLLQASVAFVGSGIAQSSAVSILVGSLGGAGMLDLIGDMRGSSRLDGQGANFFSGPVGFALDGNGNGVFGAAGPDYFVLESRTGGLRGVDTSDSNFGPGGYFPNNVASLAPGFAVGSRTASSGLQGFMNGVTMSVDSEGQPFFDPLMGFTHFANLSLTIDPATNTLLAAAQVELEFLAAFDFSFGGAGPRAYIDDQRFAALENPGESSVSIFEGPTLPLSGTRLYFLSGGLADISGLMPPGVTPCECGFMRWGFWGADFFDPGFDTSRRVHLGQWVAGQLASDAAITALTGSATYSGHAIADIVNGGRVYKAGGGFNMSYDFSDRFGSATVSNLDGRSYSFDLNGSSFANLPAGTLSAGPPGFSGQMTVGFFQNGGNPAAGVAGHFGVSDTGATYRATGIVMGQ